MELREYVAILFKRISIFIVIVVIATGLSYLTAKYSVAHYEATTAFYITREPTVAQQQAQFYQFDDFYVIQASGLFADQVVTFLANPGTVLDIYKEAGIEPPKVGASTLSRVFKAKKREPATVNLTISNPKRDEADKLIHAAINQVEKATTQLKNQTAPEGYFKIIATTPVVLEVKPDVQINTLAGLVGGIVLGIIVVFAVDYFKRSEKQESHRR